MTRLKGLEEEAKFEINLDLQETMKQKRSETDQSSACPESCYLLRCPTRNLLCSYAPKYTHLQSALIRREVFWMQGHPHQPPILINRALHLQKGMEHPKKSKRMGEQRGQTAEARRTTILQPAEQKPHSQKDRQDEKAEGYIPDEGTR